MLKLYELWVKYLNSPVLVMLPLASTLKLVASVPVIEYVPAGDPRFREAYVAMLVNSLAAIVSDSVSSAVTVAADVKVSLSVSVIDQQMCHCQTSRFQCRTG